MFVAYLERLIRVEIPLLRLVDNLNGFGGGRRIRIDAVRVFELTCNTFVTQPLVLGDVPPAQDGEDGSGAKYDAGLWVSQSQSKQPLESQFKDNGRTKLKFAALVTGKKNGEMSTCGL